MLTPRNKVLFYYLFYINLKIGFVDFHARMGARHSTARYFFFRKTWTRRGNIGHQGRLHVRTNTTRLIEDYTLVFEFQLAFILRDRSSSSSLVQLDSFWAIPVLLIPFKSSDGSVDGPDWHQWLPARSLSLQDACSWFKCDQQQHSSEIKWN